MWYLSDEPKVAQDDFWRRHGESREKAIKGGEMKTVGKCVYCNDPIYDFQELKINDKFAPLHKGCLSTIAEEAHGL